MLYFEDRPGDIPARTQSGIVSTHVSEIENMQEQQRPPFSKLDLWVPCLLLLGMLQAEKQCLPLSLRAPSSLETTDLRNYKEWRELYYVLQGGMCHFHTHIQVLSGGKWVHFLSICLT
jgi:hypothetical protein